jgi:quercetin dioxygenase-like cupin family protein
MSLHILHGPQGTVGCFQLILGDPMGTRQTHSMIAIVLFSWLFTDVAGAQLMSTCTENSPERQGRQGCSVIESKLLPEGLTEPLYWHIDRFESLAQARAAAGPAAIAFDAGPGFWLMTIESPIADHHGGRHVAHEGPLVLPEAARYTMMAQSSIFAPGMYSLVHHHSGVEAVYVVDGEACFETPARAARLREGDTLALPAGTSMRSVAIGSVPRHVLSVVVHDAAQPATMRMDEGQGPPLIPCR